MRNYDSQFNGSSCQHARRRRFSRAPANSLPPRETVPICHEDRKCGDGRFVTGARFTLSRQVKALIGSPRFSPPISHDSVATNANRYYLGARVHLLRALMRACYLCLLVVNYYFNLL